MPSSCMSFAASNVAFQQKTVVQKGEWKAEFVCWEWKAEWNNSQARFNDTRQVGFLTNKFISSCMEATLMSVSAARRENPNKEMSINIKHTYWRKWNGRTNTKQNKTNKNKQKKQKEHELETSSEVNLHSFCCKTSANFKNPSGPIGLSAHVEKKRESKS